MQTVDHAPPPPDSGPTGFGWPGFKKMSLFRQDKGQKACARAFVNAVARVGAAPIPFDEVMEVSRISIELADQ